MVTQGTGDSGRPNGCLEEIGPWTEVKLEIVKEYAEAYSTILCKKKLKHVYVDAFSGRGLFVSRVTKEPVKGSPLNALLVEPPFSHYYFIDMDSGKADDLRTLIGERSDVTYLCGDCNVVLPQEVLPHVQYRDFMRGLCLLDPYGFHLDWSILQKMGEMGSIDIFFNFSTMDIKMNAVRDDPDAVAERQKKRMNKAWGDSSWETCLYGEVPDLFDKDHRGRISMADPALASAFRKRLRTVAGFKYVPEPVAMRNKASAIVYYLFFASQQPVANRIVEDIFGKWRNRA